MLWGGRFKESLDNAALEFSTSIGIDKNLFLEDIQVSKAHSEMLWKTGIISGEDLKSIHLGLNQIESDWKSGEWIIDESKFEDIHSAIESRLYELIGAPAGKLHSGRSRNDQVATGMRLWVKKMCENIQSEILEVQKTLILLAEKHVNTIIPGYTHTQRAQPISFAFHLLAYVEMLERDFKRFDFTFNESNQSPLGSGALAGTTLPIDREYTSKYLGFSKPTANALDSVSDRDFMLDFLNACAVGMMHLSRFSEEIILWSTSEFALITLSDKFTTGSSLMPQKKNPDMAELIRGKSGRVYGNYISLMTTMKGLPMSYDRDMQEDKEPVWDSYNTYIKSLTILNGMMQDVTVHTNRFESELKEDFSLATDIADALVLNGVPFREAHEKVGKLIRFLEENKLKFSQLTEEQLKSIDDEYSVKFLNGIINTNPLERKKSYGSPNPQMVGLQIQELKARFL